MTLKSCYDFQKAAESSPYGIYQGSIFGFINHQLWSDSCYAISDSESVFYWVSNFCCIDEIIFQVNVCTNVMSLTVAGPLSSCRICNNIYEVTYLSRKGLKIDLFIVQPVTGVSLQNPQWEHIIARYVERLNKTKRSMVEPLQLRFVISSMLLQIWQLDEGPATVRNMTLCTDRQIWAVRLFIIIHKTIGLNMTNLWQLKSLSIYIFSL